MSVLIDGFKTILIFDDDITLSVRERSVTPPELDGGGPINTNSMWNTRMRTQAPKALITSGPMTCSVFWDTAVYGQLRALGGGLGRNQEISVVFPDLSGFTFWGWIDKFTPPEMQEGVEPIAELTVLPSHAMNDETLAANNPMRYRATGMEVLPMWYPADSFVLPAPRI